MSVISCIADPAGCAATAIANTIMSSWANDFANAEAQMLQILMAGWVNVPTPDLSDSTTALTFLQTTTQYLVGVVGIVGMLVAAARMMWIQRVEPLKEMLAGLFRLVVISGAGVVGIGLLTAAGDAFSTWVLQQASPNAQGAVETMGSLSAQAITSSSLIILLSSFAMLAFLVQLTLLIVRSALLVLLAGLWPLSAAASLTPLGNQWFRKNCAWILAFLLFKPVAAIVYGAAIVEYTSSGDAMGVIIGVVLMSLATLTLPALMRLVVPIVSAVGSVSNAQVAGAVVGVAGGAVAIVATGGAAAPLVAAGVGKSASSIGSSATGSGGGGGVASGAGPAPPVPPSAAPGPESPSGASGDLVASGTSPALAGGT
jgi:type IV secretion system protein TrbL